MSHLAWAGPHRVMYTAGLPVGAAAEAHVTNADSGAFDALHKHMPEEGIVNETFAMDILTAVWLLLAFRAGGGDYITVAHSDKIIPILRGTALHYFPALVPA